MRVFACILVIGTTMSTLCSGHRYPSPTVAPPPQPPFRIYFHHSTRTSNSDGDMRTACAPTRYNSPIELELECGDTFNRRGIIAVQRIYFGMDGNCNESIADWNCMVDATDMDSSSIQNIYNGNGQTDHFVTVYPVILTECKPIRSSQTVYVKYNCHDAQSLHDMCDPLTARSDDVVRFVSPNYPEVSNSDALSAGTFPLPACMCSVSVPADAAIRVTVLDRDIPCSSETFLNGSLTGYQDVWEMLQYRQAVCGKTAPYSVTVDRTSWSFIYLRHSEYRSDRRGLWFQVKGIPKGSSGKKITAKIECRTIPFTEENLGSRPGSRTVYSTRLTSTVSSPRPPSTIGSSAVTGTTNGSPPDKGPSQDSPTNTGVMMGAVASAGVVIIVVFVVCVFVMKRRGRRNSQHEKKLPNLAPNLPAMNQSTFGSGKLPPVPSAYYIPDDEDHIYAVPEDVIAEYSGYTNPVPTYLQPVDDQIGPDKSQLTNTMSNGSADSLPDYVNVPRPLSKINSVQYSHLSDQYTNVSETTTDYEKLAAT